ncbi:MAG: hypothetical protein C0442_11370, partial [Chlorobiaceae bacterium]|nr:hypothetical protein [Chlorobiaceae bacterium]
MSWFKNLTIKIKLLISFLFFVIITVVVGVLGITSGNLIAKGGEEMYYNNLVPLKTMGEIASTTQKLRISTRDIIFAQTPESIDQHKNRILGYFSNLEEYGEEYQKTIETKEEEKVFSEYLTSLAEYKSHLINLIPLAETNQDSSAFLLLADGSEMRKVVNQLEGIVGQLQTVLVNYAENKKIANRNLADSRATLLITVILLGALLTIGFGFWITGLISKPIRELALKGDRLALGEVDIEIISNTNDEIGILQKSFIKMIEGIRGNALVAEKIAAGQLDVVVNIRSEKDVLSKAFKQVVDSVKGLIEESVKLSNYAIAGNLS